MVQRGAPSARRTIARTRRRATSAGPAPAGRFATDRSASFSAGGPQVTARRRFEITRIVTAMRAALIAALRSFADAAGEPDPGLSVLGW